MQDFYCPKYSKKLSEKELDEFSEALKKIKPINNTDYLYESI
jgi:hypothetical protein